MNDQALRRALAGAAAPDELDAQRRAWAVVRGAYHETEVEAWPRRPSRPILALAVVAAGLAAAFTPPGEAVGTWLRDRLVGKEESPRVLASLPAPGRILVVSDSGPWIVRADGSKRLLGRWDDATWSPQGLHVAVTRGPRLAALTPDGEIRWSLTRAPRVADPRWSSSGFRIAYRAGRTLRVVAGDGSPDRLVARNVTRAAAWRPDESTNTLAYVAGRRLHIVDADSGRLRLSRRSDTPVAELDWTADGKYLIANTGRGLEIHPWGAGRPQRWSPMVLGGSRERAVEAAPRGSRVALLGTSGQISLFDLARPKACCETVFRSPARVGSLAWSPDGRWLLVTSPEADQWIFVGLRGRKPILTVSHVVREFDPGGEGPAVAPRLRGWCCP